MERVVTNALLQWVLQYMPFKKIMINCKCDMAQVLFEIIFVEVIFVNVILWQRREVNISNNLVLSHNIIVKYCRSQWICDIGIYCTQSQAIDVKTN